jgi:hypothetical protein
MPMKNPKTIICHCKKVVTLYDALTNQCECGQLYNGFGQKLRPKDEWEEQWED